MKAIDPSFLTPKFSIKNKNLNDYYILSVLVFLLIRSGGYAHMLIVVAFIVVNFFSILVIAPSHQLQSGRKIGGNASYKPPGPP